MDKDIRNDERFICELESSYIMFGKHQYFPGYVIQFSKGQEESINHLEIEERVQYLLESSIIGDVLLEVFDTDRINYYTLGNTLPELHTHIFPRYEWEDPTLKTHPIYHYDNHIWTAKEYEFRLDQFIHAKEDLKSKILYKLSKIEVRVDG